MNTPEIKDIDEFMAGVKHGFKLRNNGATESVAKEAIMKMYKAQQGEVDRAPETNIDTTSNGQSVGLTNTDNIDAQVPAEEANPENTPAQPVDPAAA